MKTRSAVLMGITLGLAGTGSASAEGVPDLVCRANEVVSVDHSRMSPSKYAGTEIYRFAGGKLYISSKEREEYVYGDVRQVEPGRYSSSHKVIHFGLAGAGRFRSATAVHTNSTETTVQSLSCTPLGGEKPLP